MKNIMIAGGSGFLGQILVNYFSSKKIDVKILTREPKNKNHVLWDGKNLGEWQTELEDIDVLINLTGKSVDCRYTERNKKKIYDSRINSTQLLGLAINLCNKPPKLWINSSTATIYKESFDKEMSEERGITGNDFSMNIAKSWEKAFYSITNPKTRKVVIRTAIVLGKYGGAMIPLKKISLMGLGGKQASGLQKVSWIHELDFARAVSHIIENSDLEGNFNLCVPKPTYNEKFMSSLRNSLNIPIGIPQPKWLIELGSKVIGTESELVLKSRNVIPSRLLENGFNFKYPNIDVALNQILKS